MSKYNTIFHQLHHQNNILILPNIWDVVGAKLLAQIGYKAVATSSAAVAFSRGYKDGEHLPFDELTNLLNRIVQSVDIPVSADIETAYASDNIQLKDNVKRLLDTGIVGINYEDSKHNDTQLIPIEQQSKKLEIIKNIIEQNGYNTFVNARIDVYIKATQLSNEEKLIETLKRGSSYKNAGVDGLYPIFIKDKNHISEIINQLKIPINITLTSGIPSYNELQQLGVKRLSYASGFYKATIYTMNRIAQQLIDGNGFGEATQQVVDSNFMSNLI